MQLQKKERGKTLTSPFQMKRRNKLSWHLIYRIFILANFSRIIQTSIPFNVILTTLFSFENQTSDQTKIEYLFCYSSSFFLQNK